VGVAFQNAGASTSITSVTLASTSLSLIDSQASGSASNYVASLYGLTAPSTGTQTVTINFSSSSTGYAYAMVLTGADQTDAFGISGKATSAGTPVTKSVTTTVANSWLVDVLALDPFWGPSSVQANNGNTIRASLSSVVAGSTLPTTGPGSVTDGIKWTEGAFATNAAYVVTEVIPLATITSQASSAKANILVINTDNNSVKANLKVVTNQDSSTKADIKSTASQNNSVKADIKVVTSQNNNVKANILVNTAQANSAKANLLTTYYTGMAYDWKPSYNNTSQNRGYQS
jgi:hypothetical protein